MTLVVAWTRKTHTGRELWMLSDSRLSGGKIWDYGPKIFGIGRSDTIIAFAGDTSWTYPLIAQISSYVESFINLRDRVVDVADLCKQIIQMLNDSLSFVKDTAHPSMAIPACSFIFAGYSARRKDFFVRRIEFRSKSKKFVATPPKTYGRELVAYVGDEEPVKATVRRVSEILKQSRVKRPKLDMVPAVAFFEVLSSGKFRDIGGAPQVTKVYEHMNIRHFGVYWPPNVSNEEQEIFLRGRLLKTHEVLDHPWVYDPVLAKLCWHDFSPGQLRDPTVVKLTQPLITELTL
ncbi:MULTISPECIES: hypothetical protein [Pseudomonas]|uniref:Uncharacterized protein n=1 Tax=Pseudomonas juntendi TaxID=2666183 RepID=A0ABD4YIS0_9PSED|nr:MULTISPECIES: hypothetical protein [Pseudomonas]MDH0759177.1 hypothetical protein [Pseudomonas juntendi]MDH1575442.1 hypothetical protein [Pseudomonas sp. GD03746]MDH1919925.1 hypothetical protein [Pseudomonas juntendi]QUN68638.1 hypothetical protein KDB76_04700 [Pseudomonas sp. JS425]